MITKTSSDINASKDWYYVQTFKANSYKCMNTIVFADNKKDCLTAATAWAKKNGQDGEIHLYKNNYKPEARGMVAAGNYTVFNADEVQN